MYVAKSLVSMALVGLMPTGASGTISAFTGALDDEAVPEYYDSLDEVDIHSYDTVEETFEGTLEAVAAPEMIQAFAEWAEEHSKVYRSLEEKVLRFRVWLANHNMIEAHNNMDPIPSYTLGHNSFSDMTHDEFQEYYHLGAYSAGVPNFSKPAEEEPHVPEFALRGGMTQERRLEDDFDKKHDKTPKTKDWRSEGAVTSIKNQGRCGSCWAFSATGAIEGSMVVNGYKSVDLSVEELVDCDKSDLGCSGGLMDQAFISEEGWDGMCAWEDYPYDAPDHPNDLTCKRSNCTSVEGSAIKSFTDLSPGKNTPCEESDLKKGIAKQPVAVAIQANQIAFMFYNGGVFDSHCGSMLDHGVLAVGYGEDDDGKKYWIVKNSWGEKWGEYGYIKLARASDTFEAPKAGQCGILMLPSYPTV